MSKKVMYDENEFATMKTLLSSQDLVKEVSLGGRTID